jgi:hypothetical protein
LKKPNYQRTIDVILIYSLTNLFTLKLRFNPVKKKNNTSTLELIDKEIDILSSRVMFNEVITSENLNDHFITHNSVWTLKDGWLTGKNPEESAGMAIMRKDFPGNVLIEFECRTVIPSTHDINFMWNGEWSESLNSCGNAYIGSICGWHTGRTGIEKSPDYKLRATTPHKGFEPFRTYTVHAGSLDGTCFIFIDGELALELDDPDPLDCSGYSKVAFTAWSSHIQIRNIVIRQIRSNSVSRSYLPEFQL